MAVISKNEIIAPFLSTKLTYITGQDPMGMLNIGEQVFTLVLPGLNNVTERIRYYSFYCWFFGWYAKDIGSENPKELYKYLRRAEYLLALIVAKSGEGGIAGITEARKNYNENDSSFSLAYGTGEHKDNFENTYWKNARGIFGQNYVNSLKLIGLIRDKEEESNLYIRTAFKKENIVTGKDLEQAFLQNLNEEAKSSLIKAITSGTVTQEELTVLLENFNMKAVPLHTEENRLLLEILIGFDLPLEEKPTLFRRTTTKLYLSLLNDKKSKLSDQEFLLFAYESQGCLKGVEDETLTAWYYFQLSQYWHIVNTGCLMHTLSSLHEKSDGSWYIESDLINEISSSILNELSTTLKMDTALSLLDLPLLTEDNNSIKKQVNTKNSILGFCYAFLLLKKLMVENETEINRLVVFAKKHNLVSTSDFVAVFDRLKILGQLPLKEFIPIYLKKFILDRHQLVAFNKISGSQTSEKFIREDGLIRFIEGIGFDFSNPRINTLIDFYKDLGIISLDGETVTKEGQLLLEKLEKDD